MNTLNELRLWLQGKKTYVVSGVTLGVAWLSFFLGEPVLGIEIQTLGEAMNYTLAALGMSAIRAGVSSEIKKA